MKDHREMGEKYLDLTNSDASFFFDLLLETWFGNQIKLDEMVPRLIDKSQCMVKSMMMDPAKKDKDQQGKNTDVFKNLFERVFDFCRSAVAKSVQQNVAKMRMVFH